MPLQVGMEQGPRPKAVRVRGLQYCQYSQKKISLITLLSDHVLLLIAVRNVRYLDHSATGTHCYVGLATLSTFILLRATSEQRTIKMEGTVAFRQ
jgi:hypothetical protein